MTRLDWLKVAIGTPLFVLVLVGLCFGFEVLRIYLEPLT